MKRKRAPRSPKRAGALAAAAFGPLQRPTPVQPLTLGLQGPRKHSLVAIFSKDMPSNLSSDVHRVMNATTEVVVLGHRRGGFQRKTRGPGGARFIPLPPGDGPHKAANAAAKMAARRGFTRLVFVDGSEASGAHAVPLLQKALPSESTFDIIASVNMAADPRTSQYRSTRGATLAFVPLANKMTSGEDVRMSSFIAGPRAIDGLAEQGFTGKATIGNELLVLAAAQRLRIGEVALHPRPPLAPATPLETTAAPPVWSGVLSSKVPRGGGILSRVLEPSLFRHPFVALGVPGLLVLLAGLFVAASAFYPTRALAALPAESAWVATTAIAVGLILLLFAVIVNLLVAIRNRTRTG